MDALTQLLTGLHPLAAGLWAMAITQPFAALVAVGIIVVAVRLS